MSVRPSKIGAQERYNSGSVEGATFCKDDDNRKHAAHSKSEVVTEAARRIDLVDDHDYDIENEVRMRSAQWRRELGNSRVEYTLTNTVTEK